MNVKASKTRSVPNQTYLQPSGSILVPKSPSRRTSAVRAVGPHDEIGLGDRFHLGSEHEVDADRAAPGLEDLQQPPPRDRRERVAPGAEDAILVADVDPVPARERVRDLEVGLGIGVAERPERLFAEDDTPAERRIRRVPLQHAHFHRAIELLEQDPEIEPGRAAADDLHPHPTASASRSSSSTAGVVEKSTSSSQPASS